MKATSERLAGYGTTIFQVMSEMAREHDAINLGQGFPDGNGPAALREVAARALEDQPNQYPSMMGVPELREAVANHGHRFYDLDLDPSEVMVTSGATEALAVSLFGLLNPGDEAVVFEPVYDTYVPVIQMAGAVAKPVELRPPDWKLDLDAVRAAMGPKTKLVLLNSPMNPSGKVFSESELAGLAALLEEFDAYAVCDEVYEHLTFDGEAHVPLMTLPGMRERCVRIGSAGKTFSLTGWKIGYLSACPALLAPIAKAHQFLVFTTAPNLQRAVAHGLAMADDYFLGLAQDMQKRRDLLASGLGELGFEVATCKGTYFLNAGFGRLRSDMVDREFCQLLTQKAGVAAIPISAFYGGRGPTDHLRFCFCKEEPTLARALERLSKFFS